MRGFFFAHPVVLSDSLEKASAIISFQESLMRILKFGGTSVGSAEAFDQVAKIVARARQQDAQIVVVTSAMSG